MRLCWRNDALPKKETLKNTVFSNENRGSKETRPLQKGAWPSTWHSKKSFTTPIQENGRFPINFVAFSIHFGPQNGYKIQSKSNSKIDGIKNGPKWGEWDWPNPSRPQVSRRYHSLGGFLGASWEPLGIHGRHLGRKGSARGVQVVLRPPQGAPVRPPRLIFDGFWDRFWYKNSTKNLSLFQSWFLEVFC